MQVYFFGYISVGKLVLNFSVCFLLFLLFGGVVVLFSFLFLLQLVKLAATSMCLVIKTFSLCNCQIDWDN